MLIVIWIAKLIAVIAIILATFFYLTKEADPFFRTVTMFCWPEVCFLFASGAIVGTAMVIALLGGIALVVWGPHLKYKFREWRNS